MVTYKIHKGYEGNEMCDEFLKLGYTPFAVCREDHRVMIYFREECSDRDLAAYDRDLAAEAAELRAKQTLGMK